MGRICGKVLVLSPVRIAGLCMCRYIVRESKMFVKDET